MNAHVSHISQENIMNQIFTVDTLILQYLNTNIRNNTELNNTWKTY